MLISLALDGLPENTTAFPTVVITPPATEKVQVGPPENTIVSLTVVIISLKTILAPKVGINLTYRIHKERGRKSFLNVNCLKSQIRRTLDQTFVLVIYFIS